MNVKRKTVFYLAGAFLLPIAAAVVIYAATGIYPFGGKNILALDMNNQYNSYFAYFKEILKGHHSIFYSFSKTLGGDMIGLTAYYLMSPLNIILLFFSDVNLPEAVLVITLLKLGLCGLSFYCCSMRGKKCPEGWIFSSAYALMAGNIAYQTNLMWLDSIALLPLVILGIHWICERKTPFLYLISLSLSILYNYYIGYMICLFSVLYFPAAVFSGTDRTTCRDKKIFFRYFASSLLAGGLCMWLLIPVFKSFEGGKASFSPAALLSLTQNFHWTDFFGKFFIGSTDLQQIISGLPNVYCGLTCLFFSGIFFLCREIPFRRKLAAAILLAVLYLSFWLQGPNLLWHGLNVPTWFPYRYSFLFSFLVLLCAGEGFAAAKQKHEKGGIFAGVSVLAVICLVMCAAYRKDFSFMTKEKYIWSLGVVVTAALLFVLYRVKRTRFFLLLLVPLCLAELGANGVYVLRTINYVNRGSYRQFVRESGAAVQYVKELDPGFYRLEKTFSRKECDPMLLDYNGLSHYSSTEKTSVKYFMGQTGFRNNGNWSYYNRGSTYAMDSILGVKYVLSKKEETDLPYEQAGLSGGICVYRNPYALPIGFMADDSVLSWDVNNPRKFRLQNELWKAICPELDKDIFIPETVTRVRTRNLKNSPDNPSTYQKKNTGKKAFIEYTFTASGANPVFAFFGTDDMKTVTVSVNGKDLGTYFNAYQYDIIRLGTFSQGETVKIKLMPEEDSVNVTDVWICYQDMEVFTEFFETINRGGFAAESAADTRITGTIDNSSAKDRLLFTIPYDVGWRVYVDGIRTRTDVGAGIFLTVQIPPGEHHVELRYVAPGLKTGLLLTAVSLFLLLLWIAVRYKRRRCSSGAGSERR